MLGSFRVAGGRPLYTRDRVLAASQASKSLSTGVILSLRRSDKKLQAPSPEPHLKPRGPLHPKRFRV